MFGMYVKLNKTGEIVEWNNYNPVTQELEVKLKTGVSIVGQHEIVRISADEELEFLRSKEKPN